MVWYLYNTVVMIVIVVHNDQDLVTTLTLVVIYDFNYISRYICKSLVLTITI